MWYPSDKMKKLMKKGFVPSSYEVEIKYQTLSTHGTMILDSNFFNIENKKIMKNLKDVDIISMIERNKV